MHPVMDEMLSWQNNASDRVVKEKPLRLKIESAWPVPIA